MRITTCAIIIYLLATIPTLAQLAPTMQFEVASTGGAGCCEWINARGPITERTPGDFASFLKERDGLQGIGTEIILDSPGGDLISGLKFGELIRKGKFSTRANDIIETTRCMSACAYAFLGGTVREAGQGNLGFHQFHIPPTIGAALESLDTAGSVSSTQMLVGLVALYLKEMEVDPEVLFLASSTKSDQIYLPDSETMKRLKIINKRDKEEFGGWTIEPYRAGAIVTGTMAGTSNIKTQFTLFCRRSTPNQVFLLASWSYLTPDQNKAAEATASLQTAVWRSRLRLGGETTREQKGLEGISDIHVDNSGRFFLTYGISGNEYTQGLQRGIALEIDVPNSYGGMFRFSLPVLGLKERTAISFKACL